MSALASLQARVVHRDNARYHGSKRLGTAIRGIITHLTDGPTWASAESWLNRPHSETPASYHYGIDKDGKIIRMLHPEIVAYHAGLSQHPLLPMPGNSVNGCTVGIAFACGCGHDDAPSPDRLTAAQIESGIWLHAMTMRTYQIDATHVLGHREVSPGRKFDPLPIILNMGQWRTRLSQVTV